MGSKYDIVTTSDESVQNFHKTFQSKNKKLNVELKMIEKGDKVIMYLNSYWYDSKLKKYRKRVNQSVYDV